MVVIADLIRPSRYDYCSKTMQRWHFVVVMCNFVVVWMCFIYEAVPIFFPLGEAKIVFLSLFWRPNNPINRYFKQQQYQQSHGCNNRWRDGMIFWGADFSMVPRYPTDTHTHTHTAQDPLRVEELLENREQWMGNGMNFSSEFLWPKWFEFLRNSGCGMIWKLTQKINVNVTHLSLLFFFFWS